jgi:TM2 domain-containing membrane protein YozV
MRTIIVFFLLVGISTAQSLRKDFNAKFNAMSISSAKEISNNNLTLRKSEFQKKKIGLAIFYSFLLPGMGELYADSYGSGKYFTIADGALWGTLAGFVTYGKWEENNYKAYAKAYGGVNTEGKDDRYFANIGNYIDIHQYNTEKELNREFNKFYDENTFYWSWTSQSQRREYRSMWKASENAYNAIQFIVGALILNRVASAINAVRLVNKHNRKASEKQAWNIHFGIERYGAAASNFTLYFETNF